ncbi:hypothetical protein [Nocardia transvalensis]|nr:hypothetical protein [Nocardia transvalensis]MBF6332439.1 hypothetical protein [Nocardia transvalensis]
MRYLKVFESAQVRTFSAVPEGSPRSKPVSHITTVVGEISSRYRHFPQ